jgi:hypothetical protein
MYSAIPGWRGHLEAGTCGRRQLQRRRLRVGAAAANAAKLHTVEVLERQVGQCDGGVTQRTGWLAAQRPRRGARMLGSAGGDAST